MCSAEDGQQFKFPHLIKDALQQRDTRVQGLARSAARRGGKAQQTVLVLRELVVVVVVVVVCSWQW